MGSETVKTIEDIARLASVSKSTVSRALSDSPLINIETRERIQAIAREHDFCINTPARNLSTRQSNTIAFVTHFHQCGYSVEDLFSLEIMGSIGGELAGLGYDMLVIQAKSHDTTWARQYLNSGRVDGFIVMKTGSKGAHANILAEASAPFIIWGVPDPRLNCCSVTGDNYHGGLLATEHLIRIGRKKIAFLGGPQYDLEADQRYKGYEVALKSAGMAPERNRQAFGDYTFDSGQTSAKELLAQSPDFDAIFVCSDLMAIGAIQVIQESGRRVPEDVAVVGYDDLSIAAYNNLPLTTIRQNIAMSGRLLAQNLVQCIKTGVVTHVTIPVELVVRKSA